MMRPAGLGHRLGDGLDRVVHDEARGGGSRTTSWWRTPRRACSRDGPCRRGSPATLEWPDEHPPRPAGLASLALEPAGPGPRPPSGRGWPMALKVVSSMIWNSRYSKGLPARSWRISSRWFITSMAGYAVRCSGPTVAAAVGRVRRRVVAHGQISSPTWAPCWVASASSRGTQAEPGQDQRGHRALGHQLVVQRRCRAPTRRRAPRCRSRLVGAGRR